MTKMIDMTGWKMSEHGVPNSRWTVIKRVPSNGEAKWLCQCSCDKHTIKEVVGSDLRDGKSRSCGCLQKESTHNLTREQRKLENLVGIRFGKLVAIEELPYRRDHRTIWKCKCDCGRETTANTRDLKNNKKYACEYCTKSISRGEQKIKQILEEAHIVFEREKTFSDCVSDKNYPYRFDFYLPDYNLICEYDGEQHYHNQTHFTSRLEDIQRSDKYKDDWCKNHNIKLVRIPYTEYKNITLNMILNKN